MDNENPDVYEVKKSNGPRSFYDVIDYLSENPDGTPSQRLRSTNSIAYEGVDVQNDSDELDTMEEFESEEEGKHNDSGSSIEERSSNFSMTNRDCIDSDEVFEHIRHLNDPEHPLTLEQLNVVSPSLIDVDDNANKCDVCFTPTIPHCSMATLIGLSIRVKLIRSLPPRFKVSVKVTPGTHASEHAVNKQLNDKERVAAALENTHLLKVVNKAIAHTDPIFDGEQFEG